MASYFPPFIGGSQTLLYNLLSHFPVGSYATVGWDTTRFGTSGALPCPCYHVPDSRMVQGMVVRSWLPFLPMIYRVAARAYRIERPDVLFLNVPDGAFLVAGWLLAKRLSIPYYVYLHDLWEEHERYLNAWWARRWERRILAGAKTVFTITDKARDYYLSKHGLDSKILLHTIDSANGDFPRRSRPPLGEAAPFRIVTSGSFYESMNLDALRSLRVALDRHQDESVELRILTARVNESFRREFGGKNTIIRSCTKQEVWAELVDADLLYVPLAFFSSVPEEVRTVFPTKITEYALAKVPIIVHAPEDSYTATYAQKKGWALTVTSPDPDALWNGIHQIRSNDSLRQRLADAGRSIVAEREASVISGWLQHDIGVL